MVSEFNVVNELAAVEKGRTQVVWFFRSMQKEWLNRVGLEDADTPMLILIHPVYQSGSGGNVIKEMRGSVHKGSFAVDSIQNFLVAYRKGLRADDIVIEGSLPVADTQTSRKKTDTTDKEEL